MFSNEKVKKQKIIKEIDDLDQKDNMGVMLDDMRIRRIGLLGELKILAERENAMLKQKGGWSGWRREILTLNFITLG